MRYSPSKQYLTAGLISAALAIVSAFFATEWLIALVASIVFLISAGAVLLLAFRPAVEIREKHMMIGRRAVPWADIRRVDRTGWVSPLAMHITLIDEERLLVIYPGDFDSSNSLLRHVRKNAREALIDGIPYRDFWGEAAQAPLTPQAARYQLLRNEDEAEVERLYQLLKSVGHLDEK